MLTEELRDREDEIGRGRALRQIAVKPEPNHRRHEHRDRLAEHRRFGFDPAHAPGEDAEAVHHRCVRVGPDKAVGVGVLFGVGEDDPAQVLEVHLVTDARPGRHDPEVAEGLLAPPEEPVALSVALVLERDVEGQRVPAPVEVSHHRVVDHEVDGNLRVDPIGLASERLDGIAHGGEVDHTRDAGEVL